MTKQQKDKAVRDPLTNLWPDPRPWYPPLTRGDDPYMQPAPTVADDTIAEVGSPITTIMKELPEPGESEYQWGKGRMNPISRGHVPTQVEMMRAVMRTNPADPNAQANFDGEIRE